MNSRRDFLKVISAGGISILLSGKISAQPNREPLSFGICADVHKDIMHDADQRLEAFMKDAASKNLDFIIQLGDFCIPSQENLSFMSIWNSYKGKKYHVIGNHETDGGYTREQVVEYWEMENRYYSFDLKGYHFIVLDGNEEDPSPGRPPGYARYIGQSQREWLANDLSKTTLPTLVFCHQGLDNDLGGIHNATQCRRVLEMANEEAGFQKVQLVFSGHHHQDYYNNINGIHYIQINSMSYQWLGDDYKQIRYGEEVDKTHPWIKYTAPYKDPIWAYVRISPDNLFQLIGRTSEFVGPSPEELGVDMDRFGYPIVPYISDKAIGLTEDL